MASSPQGLTAMIEQLCETETEDWALILLVCEQVSDNAGAEEAITALISLFSQGGPRHVRMNAARLWGVMINNCSHSFFERSCSPLFLAVVKEVIDQRPEGHPLRDRLVEIIGGAVYSYCRTDPASPLAHLWRQVKPSSYPVDGIPANFQAPSNAEPPLAGTNTPFTDEPPSYGLTNVRLGTTAEIVAASSRAPPPAPGTTFTPHRRMQTSSNPSTPSDGSNISELFASQFYATAIGRPMPSQMTTAPPAAAPFALQQQQQQQPVRPPPHQHRFATSPFSSVKTAFTQAVVPLATAVGGGAAQTDRNASGILQPPPPSSLAYNSGVNDSSFPRSRVVSTPPPSAPSTPAPVPSPSLGPLWTSAASTAAAIPKAFESSITSLFASMKAMRGSRATLNIPIADFCSQIVKIPKAESGKVIMLSRRRVLGAVTHEFLVLEAVTPEGVPMFVRLDRRPMSGQRRALFLLSSAATASDSAIFATMEDPLVATEQSKVDAIVPFRDSPTLHDLGKLLWFIESEAPDYRLRKENCWFFCSVIQEVLTTMFRGHNHLGSLAHPDLGREMREKIIARARGPDGLSVPREITSS